MPRPSLFSDAERASLLAAPQSEDELARHYTFNESDLALIRQRRGDDNRLGFAVQLCLLRFPGRGLTAGGAVGDAVVQWISRQLKVDAACWPEYFSRSTTRREHLLELRSYLGLRPFGLNDYRQSRTFLASTALQTDKTLVLASTALEEWRRLKVILPPVEVVERLVSEAITRANRQICAVLADPLSEAQRARLDGWLGLKPGTKITWLSWLRQSPVKPNSRHMLEHIERLREFRTLGLPDSFGHQIHRNRLLKIAREGGQMTPQNLGKFENQRRYATLVSLVLEGTATVTDQIIDLHDRIIGRLLNAARHKHQQRFQQSGRRINDQLLLYGKIGRALVKAKAEGGDAFTAIEDVIPWEEFAASVAETGKLAQAEEFDFLHLLTESWPTIRRYSPALLEALQLRAAPAGRPVLEAVEQIRALHAASVKELPADAPTAFIKKRWEKLVRTDQGLDRRNYELCALCELKNALRSGDVWVKGSRQFKDFEDYLIPAPAFGELRKTGTIPLSVNPNGGVYLRERTALLEEQLTLVDSLALANNLPDALITEAGLKMTPLDAAVPPAAQELIDRTAALLPHIKITELLLEVDSWAGFTRHFTHLKTGEPVKDKSLLLTAILADAINLGLVKMADSAPGITHTRLSWAQAWHIRDDTYAAALADLVNAQLRHPFAAHWGDGTTSSSDGQRFKSGGRAESTGHVNPKYGSDPGRMFYTHLSDQYSPFSTKVVNVGVRDATYVLDGLLYHESDLRIEEHYTDTAGFTDHVFGMMHLLGFRFAPRIRDLNETRLFVPKSDADYPSLKPLIGGKINLSHVQANWDDLLRLASSIRQGTVTASLILRKLAAYPRQNGLAVALRELGRIERTLFILTWLQSTELRRRVHAGLNKGEARNALARVVFFHRLGEIRDRNFDLQRHRASGLSLVIAAIVLWNTTYLQRAAKAVRSLHPDMDDQLLQYLSPLGWEHINLSGDYLWPALSKARAGKLRPLRRNLGP